MIYSDKLDLSNINILANFEPGDLVYIDKIFLYFFTNDSSEKYFYGEVISGFSLFLYKNLVDLNKQQSGGNTWFGKDNASNAFWFLTNRGVGFIFNRNYSICT